MTEAGLTGTKLFGTDGIRGRFGKPPLIQETIQRLGYCFGRQLTAEHQAKLSRLADYPSAPPQVLLAGDTRESTPVLIAWLAQGLGRAGINVVHAGVLPTPAVAFLTLKRGLSAGIAVSASHNPFADNGLKFFAANGFKLDDEGEQELETRLAEADREPPAARGIDDPVISGSLHDDEANGFKVASCEKDRVLAIAYQDFLLTTVGDGKPLRGQRILLDSANGAATPFAELVFEIAGAEVVALGNRPNGRNINLHCGSTAPEAAQDAIIAHGCDYGFLFDGDADRVLLVDEDGALRDGDELLLALARDLHDKGQLTPARVVATTMSNLGLDAALENAGIELVRCDVGDRAVVATLRREGLRLGAEQSGHIVDLVTSTSGDALLIALRLAGILQEKRPLPASSLFVDFVRYPQVLINVPVRHKEPFANDPEIDQARERVEAALREAKQSPLRAGGRLLLRYSGTEPVARVMIEASDIERARHLAEELAAVISRRLG